MKKYVNFLNLIEVSLFLVMLTIGVVLEAYDGIILYFGVYLIVVFLFNMFYYTYDLIKNKNTPKISVYSPTALFAYRFSLFGNAFVSIKNYSYIEFIKSANDSKNMTKGQRIKAYLYYWLLWVIIALFILSAYFEDIGIENVFGGIMLLVFIILMYRVFMLYDFADRKEGKK